MLLSLAGLPPLVGFFGKFPVPTGKIPLPPLHQILLTILAALPLGLALFPNALLDAIRAGM